MQYNGQDMNLCMFSGTIVNSPTLTYDDKKNKDTSIPVLSITIQQKTTNTLIPCIALGNFAIKLSCILTQNDCISIHSSFIPRNMDGKYVFRFLISYCVITEKQVSPIPLSFQQDNNTLDLLHYLE